MFPEWSRYKKTEALAAKQRVADARVRDVGSSLIQYERAAVKMVQQANVQIAQAQKEAEAAQSHAETMAAWEVKATAAMDVNSRTQGLWQARAIRQMRRGKWRLHSLLWKPEHVNLGILSPCNSCAPVTGGAQQCIAAWVEFATKNRTHRKALRCCASKYVRRNEFIVWHGWCKFVQMQTVEGALAKADRAAEEARESTATKLRAEHKSALAADRAEAAYTQMKLAEARATSAEVDRDVALADAARCSMRELAERELRQKVEQTQQDTRNAWIAEKRQREVLEEKTQAQLHELELVRADLEQTRVELAKLRRQAIASRYDAWSGRKIGILPKLKS